MRIFTSALTLTVGMLCINVLGQTNKVAEIARQLMSDHSDIKESDVQNLHVDASHVSNTSGVYYMYLNQQANGIRIKNSTVNAAFSSGNKLVNLKGSPIANVLLKAESAEPSFGLTAAIEGTLSRLGILGTLAVAQLEGNLYSMEIDGGNYRHHTKAELVYWLTAEEELKLAWSFNVDLPDQSHWYDFIVSAQTGEELARVDWQLSCTHLGSHSEAHEGCSHAGEDLNTMSSKRTTLDGSVYNVFPFPVESPNHGSRDLVLEPALPMASPFGWHDIDGSPGADFTITRGNNVHAYEDASNNNFPGESADGGEELVFDFPLNLSNSPESYQLASITNLFYVNNMIHDLLYVYGFDEASGNFQDNNYGNGGLQNDEVRAEAQDGEDFNNANMATPGDGASPRMQMYLWDSGSISGSFSINAPEGLSGTYAATPPADFGPELPPEGFSGDLALAIDAVSPTLNGCSEFINPEEVEGKIALLYRGGCSFIDKVMFAQEAGAIGVLAMNNVIGEENLSAIPGASDDVDIPCIMVSWDTGQLLLDALENEITVNVTMQNAFGNIFKDGSFDNGIVVHEFVHGLTNRLTGGANSSGCLFNEEQMGEGWSDWYSLMFTLNIDNSNPTFRPMGTFASGEPTDGNGIRPVPYDTSFAINDYTYADLGNSSISIPHGVGFVWSTMLWDLTWALIDEYGYDPDLFNGNAGNTIALSLVTEALKLQPCGPGFVDGRDAILLADQLLYEGANECLIWQVFAKRGLGANADQGSANSRSDGTADFAIPNLCQPVFVPPTAGFSASAELSCSGIIEFYDESVDVPQGWLWNFGDGNTSEEQNPIHTYENQGVYTVSLTVSNTLGEDEVVQENAIEYDLPDAPADAEGTAGCVGELIQLSATSVDGNLLRWLDSNLNQVALGDNVEVTLNSENGIYYAQSYQELPIEGFAGPENVDFGTGGNHGGNFTGTVDFEVFEPLIIESALVVSGATGIRTISLYNDLSADGSTVQSIEVDIDFTGEGRIDLNFEITEPGAYSIGASQAELYRNDSGADYPYEFNEVMTIVGSSAGDDYYYYFYDLEVSTFGCVSDLAEVAVELIGEAAFDYEDDDLTVSFTDASIDATSWFWEFGDGGTSTEQNPVHTYGVIGMYEVVLTIDDGCSTTVEIPVGTTSTSNVGAAEGFAVFPNPATTTVFLKNLKFGENRLSLKLHDVSGKLVKSEDFEGEQLELSVDNLNPGIYFISVSEVGGNGILFRDKLTIVE